VGRGLRPQPNHWTESPRGDEKKAEPADLEAGFCWSRGGAYRGGGALGTSLRLGSGDRRSSAGGAAFRGGGGLE